MAPVDLGTRGFMLMADVSLVKIKTYRYLHEAEIAKTALESEGIQAFIDSEYMSTVDWAYTAPDGIGLRVNAEDVKEALEILGVEEVVEPKNSSTKPKSSIKMYVIIVAIILLAIWVFFSF